MINNMNWSATDKEQGQLITMTAREIRRKKPLKSVTKSIELSIIIIMRLETNRKYQS